MKENLGLGGWAYKQCCYGSPLMRFFVLYFELFEFAFC